MLEFAYEIGIGVTAAVAGAGVALAVSWENAKDYWRLDKRFKTLNERQDRLNGQSGEEFAQLATRIINLENTVEKANVQLKQRISLSESRLDIHSERILEYEGLNDRIKNYSNIAIQCMRRYSAVSDACTKLFKKVYACEKAIEFRKNAHDALDAEVDTLIDEVEALKKRTPLSIMNTHGDVTINFAEGKPTEALKPDKRGPGRPPGSLN